MAHSMRRCAVHLKIAGERTNCDADAEDAVQATLADMHDKGLSPTGGNLALRVKERCARLRQGEASRRDREGRYDLARRTGEAPRPAAQPATESFEDHCGDPASAIGAVSRWSLSRAIETGRASESTSCWTA